jgi:hypothetical protein
MAYDQTARLLHLVMADGAIATLTLYRAEQVIAWTRQETAAPSAPSPNRGPRPCRWWSARQASGWNASTPRSAPMPP